MDRLPVMESFLTIQGEGYHSGNLAYFIRLAGCDVGCSWCDVKESWDVTEDQYVAVKDLVTEVVNSNASIVVITGGEPLMHDLSELTQKLHEKQLSVHLETSGAYPITGTFDWITFSPKKFKIALEPFYLKADELKVIITNKQDLIWAESEASKLGANTLLYLQAEWDKREKIYPIIFSYIAKNPKWRISVQSHKYLGLP